MALEKSKYYEIIDEIKALIVNGALKTGEKMPPERELAERFGVSRVPVREALKILEYMGVLENVPGEGLYIRNIDIPELIKKLGFAYTATSRTILDLFELRITLESAACYYAALRRTEEDIDVIWNCLARMRTLLRSDGNSAGELLELRALSNEFHTCVVNAAHNSVWSSVYQYLFELLDISKQYTINSNIGSYDTLLAHEAIFNKIVQKDSEGAKSDMNGHLAFARHKLEQKLMEEEAEKDGAEKG